MKKSSTLFIALLFGTALLAQVNDKASNTISIDGYAKIVAETESYAAYILVQEEEQKINYAIVGKTSIDSIKTTLFANAKKFGINENELKLLSTSSRDIGQYPNFLVNALYEVAIKNKETASKLVNEMRFTGLKGVVIKRVFNKKNKTALSDNLYNEALNDAKTTATEIAKKAGKTIGEVKNISVRNNLLTLFNDPETNIEAFNSYNYSFNRFEIDYREKYANCTLSVTFELK